MKQQINHRFATTRFATTRFALLLALPVALLLAGVMTSCSKSENVAHPSFIAGIWENNSSADYTYQLIVNNRDSEVGSGKYCRMLRYAKRLGGAETVQGQLLYNPQSGEGDIKFKGFQAFITYTSLYAEESSEGVKSLTLFSKTTGESIPELVFKNVSFPTILPVHWQGIIKNTQGQNVITYLSLYTNEGSNAGSFTSVLDGVEYFHNFMDLKYDASTGTGAFKVIQAAPPMPLDVSFKYIVASDALEITISAQGTNLTGTLKAAASNPYDTHKQ